jgi:hypothetical protein
MAHRSSGFLMKKSIEIEPHRKPNATTQDSNFGTKALM